MSNISLRWTPDEVSKSDARPLTGRHELHNRKMFNDQSLAMMLDRLSRKQVAAYAMHMAEDGRGVRRKGRIGRLSGAELIDAVEAGRFWLEIESPEQHLDQYADLFDEIFADLHEQTPGLRVFGRKMSLVISSPGAESVYDACLPLETVWQVRGERMVHIYPIGAPFISDEQMERIALGEEADGLNYNVGFEARAEIVKLAPGRVATWPQTAPHRIVNGDGLNVAIRCAFYDWRAAVRADALRANALLRRRFGRTPISAKDGLIATHAKAALGRGASLFSSGKSEPRTIPATFKIDPASANAVKDLAAA
ncbi:MAG: hypothetical protein AAFX03_11900 [Pseudomonadota bacterium]